MNDKALVLKSNFFDNIFVLDENYVHLVSNRHNVCILADYSAKSLNDINPATFPFLTGQQAHELDRRLQITTKHLLKQFQIDSIEHRKREQNKTTAAIEKSRHLHKLLQARLLPEDPNTQFSQEMYYSSQPVRFLAAKEFAQFVVSKIEELITAKTEAIKTWISEVNERRLYWVWGGNLLATLIGALPHEFQYKTQAAKVIAAPKPITGYMSWILYYFRLGIELGLLLKHSIPGKWMSEEEQSLGFWNRLSSQWQHRKFAILNDAIWATINLLSFFWLTGVGRAGYYGNVLTGAGLLLIDVTLTVWRYLEKEAEFNATREKYKKRIAELEELLAENDIEELRIELKTLKKIKKDYEFDWTYERYSLINSIAYSAGLTIAFSLMCSFYLPEISQIITPAIAMNLNIAGALFCFVLTLIYSAIELQIELKKVHDNKDNIEKEFNELVQKFKEKQL